MHDPSFKNPGFMLGHSLATRVMVRSLARAIGAESAWRSEAQAQLRSLLDTALGQPLPDTALLAIEEALESLSREDSAAPP